MQVYLNLALAYEAQGERVKAKATYTKLLNNGDAYISSKVIMMMLVFIDEYIHSIPHSVAAG